MRKKKKVFILNFQQYNVVYVVFYACSLFTFDILHFSEYYREYKYVNDKDGNLWKPQIAIKMNVNKFW